MKALCPANSERVRKVLNVQNFVALLILPWHLKSSEALVCAKQKSCCFLLHFNQLMVFGADRNKLQFARAARQSSISQRCAESF